MANDIAEKEVETAELNEVIVEKVELGKPPKSDLCANVTIDVLCEMDPYDLMSSVEAHDTYQIAYKLCLAF